MRKTLKPQEFTSIDDFLSLRVLSLLRNTSARPRPAPGEIYRGGASASARVCSGVVGVGALCGVVRRGADGAITAHVDVRHLN